MKVKSKAKPRTKARKPAKPVSPKPSSPGPAPVDTGGMDKGSIHTRAMLAQVSVSAWTARRYDRTVTDAVNREHAASRDAGRYNKHLLGGKEAAETLNEVTAAASALRNLHYSQTLPWADEGWRLLPTENWLSYTEKLRPALARFETAVAAFVAEYPALRENAKVLLNGMYREEDYPAPSEVASKFGVSVDYQPIPSTGDLRVSLPQAQVEEIERKIAERVERATAEAMKDAWGRLEGVVKCVRDRLSDPKAVFRDSLIGNVVEMTDVLARLNVTGDAALEATRRRVASQIASLDPEDLRKDKRARKSAADQAQSILDAMADIYGGGK